MYELNIGGNDIISYQNDDFMPRATIIGKKNKKKYTKTFASKWANLKLFLKERKSLESSVKLRKINTIDQFSSKCQEIFTKKIKINLLNKKNKQILKSFKKENDCIINDINQEISSIQIFEASKILENKSRVIKDFFFSFRTNNELMLRLIEKADKNQYEKLVPFLCHFFYENFYIENNEQEEMLYIIYLLLEKEIDSLYSPCVSSFLENSFLSNFLTEMGSRYEIKQYLGLILNELIKQIEEKNISYNSMDIILNQSKNNDGIFYNMLEEDKICLNLNNSVNKNETMNKIQSESIFNKKMNYNLTLNINEIKNNSNYESNTPLKKEINQDLFNNINEKYLRKKLGEEKNEIMKQFYIRQLRKIQSSKNCDLFNGNIFYSKLKKEEKIFKSSVNEFNTSYILIITFINNLLTNLENNTIIPYEIKVISYFINILLQKKFKNISKIQCNILICKYLFDKLIFPVLDNPDILDVGKDMIISLNTRKTLNDINEVFKKLIRAELFSNNDNNYFFVIFNKFIINNFQRINDIIEKIIHVKPPNKLMDLSEQFYLNENFNLNELKREKNEINYDYSEENKNDFMQHKSICFSMKDLFLFYHIVEKNKNYFEEIKNSFDELTRKKDLEDNSNYNNMYFLITSDKYIKEVDELLNHNENKVSSIKAKNMENLLNNIISCIEYVINNVEISPNWNWVNENWNTLETFKFIHNYLTKYNLDSRIYLKKEENNIPLTWYSLYIINNIEKIKGIYAKNDFQKLYDNLESEINLKIKKLRKLNNFLTINMSTKFILIDRKIKIFNQELENVKKTELSIKTLQFIENTKIKVCLTTINDLNEISKNIKNFSKHFDKNSKNKFVLVIRQKQNEIECVHKENMDNRYYQKEKSLIKKMHCKNINQFVLHFAEYHEYIFMDIVKENKENNNKINNENEINEQKIKYRQISSKKVLEIFIKHLNEIIKKNNIFEDKTNIEQKNALNMIKNYILKNIYIKVYQNEFDIKDKQFRTLCKKLTWIEPENLNIQKAVFDKRLLKKVEYHIKKMDELSNPDNILEQFGKGVQLINSMFDFMLNQKVVDPGKLLQLIIYGIINSRPKKMIFNINFIKYFMDENQSLENIGYNLTTVQSSADYIKKLNGEQLNMDQQEFDKRCDECVYSKTFNKIISINDIDSDGE